MYISKLSFWKSPDGQIRICVDERRGQRPVVTVGFDGGEPEEHVALAPPQPDSSILFRVRNKNYRLHYGKGGERYLDDILLTERENGTRW